MSKSPTFDIKRIDPLILARMVAHYRDELIRQGLPMSIVQELTVIYQGNVLVFMAQVPESDFQITGTPTLAEIRNLTDEEYQARLQAVLGNDDEDEEEDEEDDDEEEESWKD